MRISIKVKPNSKIEKVEKANGFFLIYVKEPAQKNRANKAIIKLLSEHFKIPRSRIIILKGKNSRQKLIEMVDFRPS